MDERDDAKARLREIAALRRERALTAEEWREVAAGYRALGNDAQAAAAEARAAERETPADTAIEPAEADAPPLLPGAPQRVRKRRDGKPRPAAPRRLDEAPPPARLAVAASRGVVVVGWLLLALALGGAAWLWLPHPWEQAAPDEDPAVVYRALTERIDALLVMEGYRFVPTLNVPKRQFFVRVQLEPMMNRRAPDELAPVADAVCARVLAIMREMPRGYALGVAVYRNDGVRVGACHGVAVGPPAPES